MRDLVIIGGGPAGLSAAANAAAEGLETVLLEARAWFGGQARASGRIENYLGFPDGLSGADLTRRACRQCARLGAELLTDRRVESVKARAGDWAAVCASGDAYPARAVLVASGADWTRLTFDAPLVRYGVPAESFSEYAGAHVAVIGGANSAGQAALELARIGARVTLLARRTLDASMSAYLARRVAAHPAIAVRESVAPIGAHGGILQLSDGLALAVDAALAFIGARPNALYLPRGLARDTYGYIQTASPASFAASLPGLFVAGDIRAGSRKRVATAAGEGATAIAEIFPYVQARLAAQRGSHAQTS